MTYTAIPYTPNLERAGVVSYIMRELCRFDSVFTDYARGCKEGSCRPRRATD